MIKNQNSANEMAQQGDQELCLPCQHSRFLGGMESGLSVSEEPIEGRDADFDVQYRIELGSLSCSWRILKVATDAIEQGL